MVKKTITYENFNGEKKKKDLWFHISKTEMIRMIANGEIDPDEMKKAAAEEDPNKLFTLIEIVVQRSYGEKSADGEMFIKDEETLKRFLYSPVYDAFMTHMLKAENSVDFVRGIFPEDVVNAIINEMKKNPDIDAIEAEVQRRLALANAEIGHKDFGIVQ